MVNRILQNSFFGKEEEWQTIGNEVLESLKGTDICFQIRNEEQALFEEQERPMDTDTNLLTGDLEEGRKQYMFYTDADSYFFFCYCWTFGGCSCCATFRRSGA